MAEAILKIERKYYPLEEAVKRAAEQNVARDYRNNLIEVSSLKELPVVLRSIYVNRARSLLKLDGQNSMPEYPDKEHICVNQEI
jgi:hypothetical protein